MRWLSKSIITVAFFALLVFSSCTLPKQDTSWLTGRMYVNEETSDKIEFIGERKFVITFSSSNFYWVKDFPYTFKYVMYENDNQLNPIEMTSGEGLYFPYRILRFSNSTDEIVFTDRSDKSGVFKRVK